MCSYQLYSTSIIWNHKLLEGCLGGNIYSVFTEWTWPVYIYMSSYEHIYVYESTYVYSNSRIKKLAPDKPFSLFRDDIHIYFFLLFFFRWPTLFFKIARNNHSYFLLVIFSDASCIPRTSLVE